MEQTEGAPPPPPPPPLPAEHDADCGRETDDTPETEEELTKDGDESLHKNQGGQTSVSENQMTADEKCSEEVVQDELPRQEADGSSHISLSHFLATFSLPIFGSSIVSLQLPHNIQPPPNRRRPNSNFDPSIFNELGSCAGYSPPYIRSHSSCFDSTGESKKTYPSTAADATPGHSQDDSRGTELHGTAGPSTLQSFQGNTESAAVYDREKGVELSGSTVGVHDKPPREVSSWRPRHSQDDTSETELHETAGPSTLQHSSASDDYVFQLSTEDDSDSDSFYDREKGVELFGSTVGGHDKPLREVSSWPPGLPPQVTRNTLSDPVPLDPSLFTETISNWNNVQSPPSDERKHAEYSPSLYIPSRGHLPTIFDWRTGKQIRASSSFDSTGESKKTYTSTAADATPGHIQDDTRGTELYTTASSSTFQPSTKEDKDSDSAAVYDSEKGVESFGSTVGVHGEPDPGLSNERLARSSPGLLETLKKTPSTTSDATPGYSQDDTREKASPGKPILGMSSRVYFLPGSSSTQIHSDPQKPDGSAWEEMFPSVTAENYSTENLNLQQYLPSHFGGKGRSYSPSSLSQNFSAMNLYTPLDLSTKRIVTADTDSSDSDCETSERSKIKSAVKHKRKSKGHSSRRKKKSKKSSPGVASTVDSSDCTLDRSSPGPLRETVMKTPSTAADATPGHSQDDTRETELHATAGPSTLQNSSASDDSDFQNVLDEIRQLVNYDRWSYSPDVYKAESGENRSEMSVQSESASGAESDAQMEMETSLTVKNTLPTLSTSSSSLQLKDFQVQSPSELSGLDPGLELLDDVFLSYSSTVNTAGSGENINDKPRPSECEAGGDCDTLVKMEAPVTAVSSSVTNTQPTRPHLQLSSDPGWSQRGSSCLPRSLSVPSLSQIISAENIRPSQSLPDMLLKSSFEEFTPDITVDEDDESYRFLCSCPGLYQCSVTGLVFHMEGEGDVVYRIVSWDRRLLAQHHKKPAGPLFDIKCLQQSVCRLHLPHCEIPSTAGCHFLSVAHLNDESIEFIPPHKITETHVIINISGFSAFGNVKDEDSPPEPVRALVLLFYRPPDDQNLTSFLNVLMLPRNVVLRNVQRTRRKLVGDELYIETSSKCKLRPGQEYTLSTCPEDDSVLVQPKDEEFDEESYDNYIPSFQVTLKTVILNMKVLLRDTNSSHIVWEREICLPSAGVKRLCVQGSSDQILKDIRRNFVEGISGPVLKSLLDKLLEKTVLTDSERESADEKHNREDKARFLIDTVRRKGASSELIEFLREVDPFLCKHLGLMVT